VVWLASLLFLVTTLNSVPSVPSVPERGPEPPGADEVAALEELADWLTGGLHDGELRAMSPDDLAAAIREQPRTFELFRRYHGKEERRKLLRSFPYGGDIYDVAQRQGLDSLLVAAVVEAESGFLPGVVSPQGAVGLMQVMPETGRRYGAEDLYDPRTNLEVGSRYFRGLLDLYAGDLELALAAYNAGPAAVDRFGGVPPFSETRGFVAKVLSLYVENHQRVWDRTGATELFALR
jgi:soluble lytic murein transglycosylase-like protein